MDIKEYIESGVLESYLMGELSDGEMQEVDQLAEEHPTIAQEITEIRMALNGYATSLNNKPSSDLLDAVLSEIEEEDKAPIVRPLTKVTDEESEEVEPSKSTFPIWAVAASLLLLVSAGFNFYFYGQLQESRGEVEALTLEKTRVAERFDQTNQQLDYAKLRIAHFLNEDNIHVRMDGLEISPESYANVFWNKKTNAVFISVDNLPEPPHGHQYQLWAIKDGIAPIDAGIFDHNQLVQELKVIRGDVLAFAVTLEKEGGTPIATVDKTFVKGFLQKS